MLWTILERIIHLLTFVLLVLMMTVILTNSKSSQDVGNFGLKLDLVKQDILKVLDNNLNYTDGRLNRISENQDSYQVGMDQRVYILEQRVSQLQSTNKVSQKVIQTNIQTLTNN